MKNPVQVPNKQMVDGLLPESFEYTYGRVGLLIIMDSRPIWTNEKGTFLRVIVKPNSKEKVLISEMTTESILVNLTGPAREGKANTELVKRLSKKLGISTSAIQIVSGHKSREKVLFLEGMSVKEVEDRLNS